jgi:hypothetical protein
VSEATPPLHHLNAAAPHQIVWRQGLHLDAVEQDRALGDLAALCIQQIGDRLQRRCLARTIGAEKRDNSAPRHIQRYTLQHEDDVTVDNLDIIDRQKQRCRFCRRGGLRD